MENRNENPIDGHGELYDAIIVGGGPAGLNAALVLGRMRRRVLVLDADDPAHAVADEVHGFLAQDGTPPEVLRRLGREQLRPYESVQVRHGIVRTAHHREDGTFELTLAERRERVVGRRLLLAHGMRYGTPQIDGLSELWGRRVFHCPYCHGWEVRDQALAVYGCGERAVHQAMLLTSLSDNVVLLSPEDLGETDLQRLTLAGVVVHTTEVEHITERAGRLEIALAGEDVIERDAVFIQPRLSLASDIALSLDVELTDAGTIAVDSTGRTSVVGVYAAGDAATPVQSVAVAAGSGARAAYALNAGLALEGTVNTDSRRLQNA